MKVPTKKALLRELDRLGHGRRIERLSRLGSDARGSAELRKLTSELQAGDAFERRLALLIARSARMPEVVVSALRDPSVAVRGLAARTAGLVDDQQALTSLVLVLDAATCKLVLQTLARSLNAREVDRLFTRVRDERGTLAALPLLAASSAKMLARVLPEVAHAISSFSALARRHPDVVMEFIREQLAKAPQRERSRTWARFGTAIRVLAVTRPSETLDLALELAPAGEIPVGLRSRLKSLTRRYPSRLFALLTRPDYREALRDDGLPREILRALRFFSPDELGTLAEELADSPEHLATLLDWIAPSARAEVFRRAYAKLGADQRELPEVLLEALPHRLRDSEAQRMLELRAVRENPARSLEILAHRSVEVSRAELEAAAAAPKAEDRGKAIGLLVKCSGRYRSGVGQTLEFLLRLKNDQDPVRAEALAALSGLPPGTFEPEHAAILEKLVDFVVGARDTSYATRAHVQVLATRILQANAARPDGTLFALAISALRKLAEQAGTLALPQLEKNLPKGAEQRIARAFLPLIRAANKREGYELVMSLHQALGRRAWNVVELENLLEPVTRAKPDSTAARAIDRWLANPRKRDRRVRALLDRDRSAVRLPPVFRHLHLRRQQWLDPFLKGRAIRGQFLSGQTLYLLPALSGFQRWLPRQQASFRAALTTIAGEKRRDHWQRASAIRTISRLGVTSATDLRPFLESKDVFVAEAALAGLAWLDEPLRSLPLLLDHFGSDRARVAVYAVPRCARFIAPRELGAMLERLLATEGLKVTARKELLRLLGAFPGPHSVRLLAAEQAKPKLHRDLRIAIGHAARRLIETEEAWRLLAELADSSDADVSRSLLDQSADAFDPRARRRYVMLLLRVARQPDLRLRREAFSAITRWSAGSEDEIARAAADRIADIEEGVEWASALDALVTACQDGRAADALIALVGKLLAAPPREGHDAGSERDLPSRQRLQRLCQRLCALPEENLLVLSSTLGSAAALFASDPSLWPLEAGLRIAAVRWDDAEAAARVVLELTQRAEEEPEFVTALAGSLAARLSASTRWKPEDLFSFLDRLDHDSSVAARLAELSVLRVLGPRLLWNQPCAARLRRLRAHDSASVRNAARSTWTRVE
jgi:hypothetical protein